jgi:hypothetical protein
MNLKNIGIVFCLIIILFLINCNICSGENAFERLMKAKSVRCNLKDGYSAVWKDGDIKMNKGKFSDDEKDSILIYDSISIKNSSARVIGNQSSADVVVLATQTGLTFIEKTPVGYHMIMTVFPYYKRGTNEFVCVYSRHFGSMSQLRLGPMPSQWHGTCKIWE